MALKWQLPLLLLSPSFFLPFFLAISPMRPFNWSKSKRICSPSVCPPSTFPPLTHPIVQTKLLMSKIPVMRTQLECLNQCIIFHFLEYVWAITQLHVFEYADLASGKMQHCTFVLCESGSAWTLRTDLRRTQRLVNYLCKTLLARRRSLLITATMNFAPQTLTFAPRALDHLRNLPLAVGSFFLNCLKTVACSSFVVVFLLKVLLLSWVSQSEWRWGDWQRFSLKELNDSYRKYLKKNKRISEYLCMK